MANRHLARTIALQTLFEWDFTAGKKDIKKIFNYTKEEFAPDFDDQGFSFALIKNVTAKQKELDNIIASFAPDWPIDQITITDRNVLRIGVYELKLDPDIPPKVAINESIELAKAFGGDSSGKFVNGVLGSIYKEMIKNGEKQDLSSQGIREVSAGGMVYRKEDDGYYFALILDAYDKWTFSKGKVEKDEKEEDAALRELTEETGLKKLTSKGYLGETEVKVHKPNEKPYRKLIKYFLVEAKDKKLIVPNVTELKDVKWFPLKDAFDRLDYDNAKDIFNIGLEKLGLK
ncbi:MAG: transcription antitermination factor NusB [Candidatus Komeilibacteria bacterium]|jgi:transcription antitermination protein NusB|nr:transcription antitermination factor NusB [Candidatus Komeilibacteria bacterium]